MKKFLVLLLALCFGLGVLTACGNDQQSETNNTETSAETTETQQEELAEKYDLQSEEVEIYIVPGNGNINVVSIADKNDIDKLINSVCFSEWRKADIAQGDGYAGILYYYVKFNENTTIAVYEDVPYGIIGKGFPDALGNLSEHDVIGPYHMPQGFLETIKQMMQKY